MRYSLFDGQRDIIILIARILLMILFVLSGWAKLTGFDGTVGYMTSLGAPAPMLAAGIAVIRIGTLTLLRTFLQPAASLPRAFLFSAHASQAYAGILWARPPRP